MIFANPDQMFGPPEDQLGYLSTPEGVVTAGGSVSAPPPPAAVNDLLRRKSGMLGPSAESIAPVTPYWPQMTLTEDGGYGGETFLTDMEWDDLTPSQQVWIMAYSEFDQEHQNRYGIPIDRVWTNAAQSAKESIDNRYKELLKEYSAQLGEEIPVDESLLGPNAQPNRFYAKPKHHGGLTGFVLSAIDNAPLVLGSLLGGAAAGGALGGVAEAGAASSIGSPQVIAATQGAISGAISAAGSGGDVLQGALTGATTGYTTGGFGGDVAEMMKNPHIAASITGAARGAMTAAINGGNIAEGAKYGALSAAVSDAPNAVSSLFGGPVGDADMDELLNELDAALLDAERAAPQSGFERMVGQGRPGMFTPVNAPSELDLLRGASYPALGAGALPMSTLPPDYLSQTAGLLAAGAQTRADEAADTPSVSAASPTQELSKADYQKYAQHVLDLYKQVSGFTGSVGGFDMPVQEEGQSDEEYAAEVGQAAVEYLSLDADAMRAAGLVPGTPGYMGYILDQADAIIEGVFGAVEGESVEGLQQALRSLTESEATQLVQALYVRGALGRLSAQSSAIDPFTGQEQELGMLPGEVADPNIAAHQRGLADILTRVAGLSPGAAREQLSGLFGRNVDLFGMQAAADKRAEEARRADLETEDDEDDTDLVDTYGNLRKRRRKSR